MKASKLLVLSLLLSAAPPAVFASSESDEQIEKAARESYNYHTVLQDRVAVDAEDGVVELTGTVSDKSLKTLAEDTVRSVPGVVEVNNRIDVEPPPPEHSDAWVALKVRTSLLVHANVSLTETDVAVADGVVTLSGMVDNVAQEELTVAYVQDIEGVKKIVNRIVIKPATPEKRSMGTVIDDASITGRVKYELLTHRSTSALKTNVTTKKGIVTIEGDAANEAERVLVAKLAESVNGVKFVDNKMTVKETP